MNNRQVLGVSLLLVLVSAVGSVGFARQDKGAPPSKPAPSGGQAAPADANAMQAKWKEFGTPGAAHKVLDALIGKWTVEVKMFEPGSAAPEQSRAASEMKWVMDGHFVQETVTGEFKGQPFQGLGTTGYDNLKKKYVMSWIDNMSTGLMATEGTYDAASKTFSWTGECPDVMAGKYVRSRSTLKMVDADHWTMQSFKAGADGKEAMAAQLDYTRVKS